MQPHNSTPRRRRAPWGPRLWWRRTAVVIVLLAACLPFAARLLAGPPGGDVHVRWQPSVDEATRRALEARFHLLDGQQLEPYTWRYDLTDPSRDNIRALVNDPAVADTHDIDRPSYSLTPSTIRTARRLRFPNSGDTIAAVGDWLAMTLVALAGLLAVLGISGRAETPHAVGALLVQSMRSLLAAARTAWAALLRFLPRGIPELDAETAGLFRIVFGILLLLFFYSRRVDASWLSATFDLEVEGALHAWVLQWLRERPFIVDGLTPWLLTTGAAFTVGIFTRVSYSLFVAGVLVWAFVALSLDSTHPHSTLVLTLVALLPSRWGDVRSIDRWLRRRRGEHGTALRPGKHYGYSVWIPGLVFGVGYAAAAWAKLAQGPEWILNGTIKYHFITDSGLAPIDWGLQLVRYPRLAILMSFYAVATEALVVTAAFTRSQLYRLTMGFAAFGLLGGFYLFMGHFWPGWWILLVGFLPWQSLVGRSLAPPLAGRAAFAHSASAFAEATADRSAPKKGPPYVYQTTRTLTAPVTMAQLAVIAAVIAQQVVFSTIRIERAPMFSYYPMYSGWYSGPDDYEASRPLKYRLIAATDQGDVELNCHPYEEFVKEFQAAVNGSGAASANVWRTLGSCIKDFASVQAVTLEGDRLSFDFDRLEFTSTRAAVVLGPLPADDGGTPASAH